MNEFEIIITSPPDREKLVAEVWYGEMLVAEVNQEAEELEIEFYLNDRVTFELNEFLKILEKAKSKIVGAH